MSQAITTVCRITTIINSEFSHNDNIIEEVRNCGIAVLSLNTGRAVMLNENSGLVSGIVKGRTSLVSTPVHIVSFLVHPDGELDALNLIAEKFKLNISGNGSVYSEMVTLVKNPVETNNTLLLTDKTYHMQTQLTGICCIVVRGQGDVVAKVALDTGSCVPTIKYGQGAGLRDRLGLWRITVPAEKEIVEMIVNSYEVEEIMNIIIDVAKIDQPGRGFIFVFPVRQGLINMKVNQTSRSHAASMEQVILAMDEVKGGTEWRRRRLLSGVENKRKHLTGLTDLTLCCEEGNGAELVKIAMAAGASGATVSEFKLLSKPDALLKISPARESCSMIVPSKNVPQIVGALGDAGVFDGAGYNGMETRAVFRAFSYIAR